LSVSAAGRDGARLLAFASEFFFALAPGRLERVDMQIQPMHGLNLRVREM
jgi:hypothetical protein